MNPIHIINLKETDSTNTYAKALLKSGELSAPFTLILAENQTAGRGRLSREWLSTEGDTLCMSLIAPYPYNPAVTLLAALGVYRALSRFIVSDLKIKWPNDLIYKNKKLCGILTESTDKHAIIGIGINLNNTDFPEVIRNKATSLKMITGEKYLPKDVAKSVTESIVSILTSTQGEFTENMLSEYSGLCANIGREVSFADKTGIAVGIAPDGCLIVKTSQGIEHINSGEVTVSGIY